MGIRVQPREIEVPQEDPFKHDLLERKEAVETLTHLIGNLEGPCVLSVDAVWGSGKTTFMKIWAQHLRNQGFPVVEFNVWETDFSENPFLTLSTELTEGLESREMEDMSETIETLKNASQAVFRWAVPKAAGVLLSQAPLVGPQLAEFATSLVEDQFSRHSETRKSVKSFKTVLQGAAGRLSEASGDHPLVIMIDELDRCRPSYAVELLEIAKHLFSVDHIIFVLAVNCDQLAHSIKAVYGSEFDAVGYLRRFFDVDFKLPEPDRQAFIENQLEETGIYDYFKQFPDKHRQYAQIYRQKELARDKARGKLQAILYLFFGSSDLSLRTISQAIHRLGLLYASLPDDRPDYGCATVAALILRTLDPTLYSRFVAGEVSDKEVVETIFSRPGLMSQLDDDGRFEFEVVIILAAMELDSLNRGNVRRRAMSPLLSKYQNLDPTDKNVIETDGEPRAPPVVVAKHGDRVSKGVERALEYGDDLVGFEDAVRRLELFSDELVPR